MSAIRLLKTLAIPLIILALIIAILIYRSQTPIPPERVTEILRRHLISSSANENLTYGIVSMEQISSPTIDGDVWCVIVEPEVNLTGSGGIFELKSHFIVAKPFQSWLVFGYTNEDLAEWDEAGCSDN